MNKIETVIFDIGNVLMDFQLADFIKRLYGDEMHERMDKAYFDNGRWDELDRGEMPVEEIFDSFVKADPEIEEQLRYVFENLHQCMGKREYAIPLVKSVKRSGKSVYYLSNYSQHVIDAKPEVLDFIEYMDGGVFSYKVKAVKPEEKIYKELIEKYDLIPEKCVFIDDRKENLEAAKKLGFHTIWFNGYNNNLMDLLSAPLYY